MPTPWRTHASWCGWRGNRARRCSLSSSVRCAKAVREVLEGREQFGAVLGMSACGPTIPLGGAYPMHGLQFYGVHTIELVNQMMGGGVNWVSSVAEGERNILTLGWAGGRMASLLLGSAHHSPGENAHSFIAWCEKDIAVRYAQPDGLYLLRQIIQFFRDGKAPVSPDQSLEVIAIIEAAMASEARNGARIMLSEAG